MMPRILATLHSQKRNAEADAPLVVERVELDQPIRHDPHPLADLIERWNTPLLPAGKRRPLPPSRNPAAFFFPKAS